MNYAAAAEQEYVRFQANYGLNTLHEALPDIQNMLNAQTAQTAMLVDAMAAANAENNKQILAELSKPRNRTVIRDAEGKISGVRDE